MTTLLKNGADPFQISLLSEESGNYLIATENYTLAMDELQSAAAELRAAVATLKMLTEQCRPEASECPARSGN